MTIRPAMSVALNPLILAIPTATSVSGLARLVQ